MGITKRPTLGAVKMSRKGRCCMRYSLLLAAAVATAGCVTNPGFGNGFASPGGSTAIPYRRDDGVSAALQGHSGLADSTRMVIRNQSRFQDSWARLVAHVYPVPEMPSIDFSREMVIIASAGTKPSSGYSIRIGRLARVDGVIYADVVSERPGSSCLVNSMPTMPADLIIAPNSNEAVTFVERSTVRNCTAAFSH